MACEVKDCGSYIYPTLRKYMRHWHRIHKEEHHDLLVCPRSTQNFEKLYFLTRHLQSDHHLLLTVSKEMVAKASFVKNPTNCSILQGILFLQYFGKTIAKLKITRTHRWKRENKQKRKRENKSRREQAKLEENFYLRKNVIPILEMR